MPRLSLRSFCWSLVLLAACSAEQRLRWNEIQVLGSHNSYHIEPEPELLAAIASVEPALAAALEYTALPLDEQLERGVRQFEFDVFADPEGGRYASRAGWLALGREPRSGEAELEAPGLKVLHVQDIDFRTHCLTFMACLEQLRDWSERHARHLPVWVLVEAKQDPIEDPMGLGFVTPLPFDAEQLDVIDAEIRAVFPPSRLITPDDVRGAEESLEAAVLAGGWPSLFEASGRFAFALSNRGTIPLLYASGHPGLRGRAMFANSVRGTAEAAFFNLDSALIDGDEIRELVRAGYLVRTRADIDTAEARRGDTALQEAAFRSGAQFISTDYVVPDPDFGTNYSAAVPGRFVARCNALNSPIDCDSERLSAFESEGGGLPRP